MSAADLMQLVDALAERLADRVCERMNAGEVRPRLLTLAQAGVYLNRSASAMRRLVSGGKIPYVRSDRRVFIDVFDIDKWISGHKA